MPAGGGEGSRRKCRKLNKTAAFCLLSFFLVVVNSECRQRTTRRECLASVDSLDNATHVASESFMRKFFGMLLAVAFIAAIILLQICGAKMMHLSSESMYSTTRDVAGFAWAIIAMLDGFVAMLVLVVLMKSYEVEADDTSLLGRFILAMEESAVFNFTVSTVGMFTLWAFAGLLIKGIEAVLY